MTTREKQSLAFDLSRYIAKYHYYCKWRELDAEDFSEKVEHDTFIRAEERAHTAFAIASSLIPYDERVRIANSAMTRGYDIAVEQLSAPFNPLA